MLLLFCSPSNILGSKKYFDSEILLQFQLELIMHFIPNESSSKMGFIGAKQLEL